MEEETGSKMENKALAQRNSNSQLKYYPDQHSKDIYYKKQNNVTKYKSTQPEISSRRDSRGAGSSKTGNGKRERWKDKEGGQVEGLEEWSFEDNDLDLPETSSESLSNGRRKMNPGGGRKSSSKHDFSDHFQPSYNNARKRERPNGGGRRNIGRKTSYNGTKHKLWLARCQFLVNPVVEKGLKASSKLPVGVTSLAPQAEDSEDQKTPSLFLDDSIEWTAVEEVSLLVSQDTHCPVCLYSPVAPQVTICGHVYCYPCILHYLALSDEKGRKCPICDEHVMQEQLRSVKVVVNTEYRVGERITLILMRRHRESMIPQAMQDREEVVNMARKTKADLQKVLCIIEREITALEVQLVEDEDQPEVIFTQQAIHLVKEKEKIWRKRYEKREEISSDDSCVDIRNLATDLSACDVSNNIECKDSSPAVVNDRRSSPAESPKRNSVPKQIYYFYQAKDGAHLYLNALNLSMLINEYGEEEDLPLEITSTILEKEYSVMSESLRERSKFLRHLPLHCPYETLELDLSPPLVSEKTLSLYQERLQRRERTRRGRLREEQRIERRNLALQEQELSGRLYKRINSEASAIQGTEIGTPSNDIKTLDQHFPQMGATPQCGEKNSSPPPSVSFANMVRVKTQPRGKLVSTSQWPSLSSNSTQSTGAWGSTSKAWGRPSTAPHQEQLGQEEQFSVPDFKKTFSQGVDALFEPSNNGAGRKKGKKGKKK